MKVSIRIVFFVFVIFFIFSTGFGQIKNDKVIPKTELNKNNSTIKKTPLSKIKHSKINLLKVKILHPRYFLNNFLYLNKNQRPVLSPITFKDTFEDTPETPSDSIVANNDVKETYSGRFAANIYGFKSIVKAPENTNIGWGLGLKFFPSEKFALGVSYFSQNSDFEIYKTSFSQKAIVLGFERYWLISKLNPFLGADLGLHFEKTTSDLLKLPYNIESYYQEYERKYIFSPKLGLLYNINDKIFASLQANYDLVINPSSISSNLYNDSDNSFIIPSNKNLRFSVGIVYKFKE